MTVMQNRHVSPALAWLILVSANVFSSSLYTGLEFLYSPTQDYVLRPVALKVHVNDLVKEVNSKVTKFADSTKYSKGEQTVKFCRRFS